MRKNYSLKEDYFKEINSEDSAYALGFIFADGNINDFNKDKHYRMRIHLKASDSDVLYKIKDAMGFGGEVRFRDLKSSDKSRDGYKISCLEISSKQLILDLTKLGCLPNKSLSCTYPDINPSMDKYFIRGYFDANGAVYFTKQTLTKISDIHLSISSGSSFLLKSVINKIENNVPDLTTTGLRLRHNNCEYVKTGKQATSILNWIYSESSIHLDRKYSLYQQIVNMPS